MHEACVHEAIGLRACLCVAAAASVEWSVRCALDLTSSHRLCSAIEQSLVQAQADAAAAAATGHRRIFFSEYNSHRKVGRARFMAMCRFTQHNFMKCVC